MKSKMPEGSPADAARPDLDAEDAARVQRGIQLAQQIKTCGSWLNWLAGLIVLYLLFLTASFYMPLGRPYMPNILHRILMQQQPGIGEQTLAVILILGMAAVFFLLGQIALHRLKLAWICLAAGFLIYAADLAALYWLHFIDKHKRLDFVFGIEVAFHLFLLFMFGRGALAGLRYIAIARKEIYYK